MKSVTVYLRGSAVGLSDSECFLALRKAVGTRHAERVQRDRGRYGGSVETRLESWRQSHVWLSPDWKNFKLSVGYGVMPRAFARVFRAGSAFAALCHELQ